MNDYSDHLICHYLDEPPRVFYWTMDEAFFLCGMPFIAALTGKYLFGFGVAFFGYFLLRKLKKNLGLGALRRMIYWYLPRSKRSLHKSPDSCIREYIA